MADTLQLASASRIFQCPNCGETIDTAAERCRFCSSPIDPAAAEMAANLMAKVNQACSDASYLKIAAVAMLAFIGMMFVPFLGLVGFGGYYFLMFAIPVLVIRWWIKFGRIKSDDKEFGSGKTIVIVITVLALLPLVLRLATL